MKIIIPDDYQNTVRQLNCFKLIADQDVTIYNDTVKDIDALAERFADAEILILIRERTEITEALLNRLPKLKLISQTGKISNHLDLNACTRHNVAVAEGIGSPIAPAELTWTLIMNAVRKLPQAIQAMQNGLWQTNIGSTIHGKTIGIWGYGKIGQKIALYAKAFGANVLVWGSENSRNQALKDGHSAAESKSFFFRNSDIVTLHLRLNESTHEIVKESDLLMMKPNAIIVNTSRAELIQKNALINSLQQGRPGFAAVDVYESEPITDIHYPLLQMPNVICTPHLGYVEQNSYELYFEYAFKNIIAFINHNPINIANPIVLGI
ncbi:D-2-hydroxyacid dehydrogenase family protein [Flavobacterium cerinum]|uniref:D-2-hydroxyacid dehydrogenase family protein n=1 Tax=Flavobacterium cerinum TaxID=2502784 RepID=A0ABY5IS64_9FLAO|nr:D-2-hydroxyacid dehydrogenase family protein [Flavobacterium cerinum]UUC45624.1 D-2-hydroxyacid dehydrogenase family protein [Flavobacterium cerinum]